MIYAAEVSRNSAGTPMKWVVDSDYRFFPTMRDDSFGYVFLEHGQVVQPNPHRLMEYQTRSGHLRGQWPGSPEISAAMFQSLAEEKGYLRD